MAIDLLPLKAMPGNDETSQLYVHDGIVTVTVKRGDLNLSAIQSTNAEATVWTVIKADGTLYDWHGKLRSAEAPQAILEWLPANDEIRRTPLGVPQFAPSGFTLQDVRTNGDLIGKCLQECSLSNDHIKEWEIVSIDSAHGRVILRHVGRRPGLPSQRELPLTSTTLLSVVEVTINGEAKTLHHLRNDRGGTLFELRQIDGHYTAKPLPELRALPINLVRNSLGMNSVQEVHSHAANRRHNLSTEQLNQLRKEVSAEFGNAERFKEPQIGSDPHSGEHLFFCASRVNSCANKNVMQINSEDDVQDSPDWRRLELTIEGATIIRYRPVHDSDKHKGAFYEIAEDQDGNPIMQRDYCIFTRADVQQMTDRKVTVAHRQSFVPGEAEAPPMLDPSGVDSCSIPTFADDNARIKVKNMLRMFDNDKSFVEFLCKRIERMHGEKREIARKELRDYAAMSTNDRRWTRTEVIIAATDLIDKTWQPTEVISKSATIGKTAMAVGGLAIELLNHSQDASVFAPPPVAALTQRLSQVAALTQRLSQVVVTTTAPATI